MNKTIDSVESIVFLWQNSEEISKKTSKKTCVQVVDVLK